MSFRKRRFQELVDNVLTDLTGGVVNEPVLFTAPNGGTPTFPLGVAPVARIVSVTGTAAGEFRPFSDGAFELSGDRAAIRWPGDERPDDRTTFFVDYYPDAAQSPITDRNVGSVARTLVEAVTREIATLYEQLDLVYRSGFIETAEGSALDFLVALLGVRRIRAGREVGEVVFARSSPAPGDITVPLGTVVSTPPLGEAQQVFEFETTAGGTLRQGQTEIARPIRFRPTPEQQANFTSGQVPAGGITLLPKPIVGIETVTNPEPTTRGTEDESDGQLRQRASKALAEAGKATADALRAAVLSHGPGVSVAVKELPRGIPGEVDLVVAGADDERRREAIFRSVLATKAAGVMVLPSHAETVEINLELRLESLDDVQLSREEARRIETTIAAEIAGFVNGLRAGEDVSRNALVALGLSDRRLRSLTVEGLATRRKGLVEDSVERVRDGLGNPTDDLNLFDHIRIGEFEKAAALQVAVTVVAGRAEVEATTAVRITVNFSANRTAAGETIQPDEIKPQLQTLARGFIEAPERGAEVRLADLNDFLQRGSGLFTAKPFPASFLIAEHLNTGLVERDVDVVRLEEKERAELAELLLTLD